MNDLNILPNQRKYRQFGRRRNSMIGELLRRGRRQIGLMKGKGARYEIYRIGGILQLVGAEQGKQINASVKLI